MSWYTDTLIHLSSFNSPARVSSLDYLEPTMRSAVEAIIHESATQNMPLLVFETYRSEKRQKLLFEQGATQLEEVGVHAFGLACDLVKDVAGEPSWKGDFGFLGVLAKKHGLIWGGNWGLPAKLHGFVDAVHVQRISVKDQVKLFDKQFYPDVNYNPYK